jgi:hypothetical protein
MVRGWLGLYPHIGPLSVGRGHPRPCSATVVQGDLGHCGGAPVVAEVLGGVPVEEGFDSPGAASGLSDENL